MPPKLKVIKKIAAPTKLDLIQSDGKRFIGKKEYVEILEGKHSTPRKRIFAMCYECMGWYADGAGDCKQKSCPLYGMMPYRGKTSPKEIDQG